MTTPVDIKTLCDLVLKATPLPWVRHGKNGYAWTISTTRKEDTHVPRVVCHNHPSEQFGPQREHDAEFIVTACNAIPALLLELETARNETQKAKEYLKILKDKLNKMTTKQKVDAAIAAYRRPQSGKRAPMLSAIEVLLADSTN